MKGGTVLLASLRTTLPSVGIIILILILSLVFRPNFWILVLLLIAYQNISYAYTHIKNRTKGEPSIIFKTSSATVVTIWVLYFITGWLGGYGIIGFIILGVIIALYILWKRKDYYMFWIEHIEREFLYDGKTATEIKEEKRGKKNATSTKQKRNRTI